MKYLRFAGLLLAVILLGSWFWPLLLLGWLGRKLAQAAKARRHGRKPGVPNEMSAQKEAVKLPEISEEPDMPAPFGYKIQWAAVRCRDPEQVIEVLRPAARRPANWKSGLARAYATQHMPQAREVFVSACLNGFVLVIGLCPEEARLAEEGNSFAEVQLFGSHRVSDGYLWEKYRNGICIRKYMYADGEVEEEGGLTPEELALGFDRLPTREAGLTEDASWEMMRMPNEEDVLDIAAAWGVDPRFQDAAYPCSTGWLCSIG